MIDLITGIDSYAADNIPGSSSTLSIYLVISSATYTVIDNTNVTQYSTHAYNV